MCIHVDDIVATPSSESIRAAFESALVDYFGKERVTGGEETHYVLGMRIDRDWEAGTVKISQPAAISKLAAKFHLDDITKTGAPLIPMRPDL